MSDCTCKEQEEPFEPSSRHRELRAEVEGYIEKWRPYLPWIDGWQIKVKPIPDGCGLWSMRVESASYVKGAVIEVRESALDEAEADFLWDEHSVELVVLHELVHLALEPMRHVFYNWVAEEDGASSPAVRSMTDAEEFSTWNICRALMRMQAVLVKDVPNAAADNAAAGRKAMKRAFGG